MKGEFPLLFGLKNVWMSRDLLFNLRTIYFKELKFMELFIYEVHISYWIIVLIILL